MKISTLGISLVLLVVILYFASFPAALAGPDMTPPTLTSVSISSDGVGGIWATDVVPDIVTLTFTSDEAIMTPVVTIGGQPAGVAGGPLMWTATRVMDGTEADGTNVFTIDFSDLVGNAGTQVTTTTDASSVTIDVTAPMVTTSEITAGNTVTIVYDEPVISSVGDYTVLNLNPSGARAIMGHGGSGTTTILLTFVAPAANVDEDGTITIGAGVTDRAGNIINMPGNQALTDGQAPSLDSVTISSDGIGGIWATDVAPADTVTLSFTANETINTPVVTIGGQPAGVAGGPLMWTATRVMDGTEADGTNVFTIDFSDLVGNAGTQVTTTTDASSVTIDETAPTLSSVSIISDNVLDTTLAIVGDTVTLSFTANENIMTPTEMMIRIDGNDADMGSVAGAGTSWSALRVMQTGDTETPAPIAFTIDFTDLAGNIGTQVTTTTDASSVTYDETAPMVTSSEITAGNTVTIVYDEPVISAMGDYANLMIGGASRNVLGSTSLSASIDLTFDAPNSAVDDTGSVDILAGLTDLAGNPFAASGFILDDGQAPSLDSVTISSDGIGGIWATDVAPADTVTLSFTANETINTPVVTIGGQPAGVAGGPLMWTATRTMDGTEADGTNVFTIDFSDLVGNAGTQVTTTTDASSVTIDETAPMVTSAAVTADYTVTIVYDEPVNTVIGDYSALVIGIPRIINSLSFGTPDTVILSFITSVYKVDATGSITIGAGITDRAGNLFTPVVNQMLADGQPATVRNIATVGRGSAPSFSSISSDSSITMSPISINGKHYNFIQSGNLVPLETIPIKDDFSDESKGVEPITNVIKVGQLTHLKFVTFTNRGADHIQHAAIYTNLKGNSINPSSDTIGIIYDKGKELKILDKNNILSHADIKVSGEGNRVELKVNIIFAEKMKTSDLVLRMWDENRFPLYAHIENAWKVVENPELVDLSAFEETSIELNSKNPPKEILKEEAISAIKKWAGYDLEVVSDSQLLNTIGINGDNIPKWLKKSAKWIVNEEISLDEFIDALRFVQNIKT